MNTTANNLNPFENNDTSQQSDFISSVRYDNGSPIASNRATARKSLAKKYNNNICYVNNVTTIESIKSD